MLRLFAAWVLRYVAHT